MRGTPISGNRKRCRNGIIPAHAGNTASVAVKPLCVRDHPRACGEHPVAKLAPDRPMGSSPRMRGTPGLPRPDGVYTRIIPAHAGNTMGWAGIRSAGWDHPRACGEHMTTIGKTERKGGSSPRMRGTLLYFQHTVWYTGIIPAHAGNTFRAPKAIGQSRDHPRACGEHLPWPRRAVP